jgi:two-component system, LytTR family, sensor kinase
MTDNVAIDEGMISRFRSWMDRKMAPGTVVALFMIAIVTMFLLAGEADAEATVAWFLLSFSGVFLYNYAFRTLLPEALKKPAPWSAYIWKMIGLVVAGTEIPIMLVFLAAFGDTPSSFAVGFANIVFQLAITTPLAWFVYKRYHRRKEELSILKKELGQSEASIDFLRTQINPHFLFNALNTLYGTALQEKADRTGEGIQRLGDMMRFMLAENNLERISLTRELDYLKNYITLQRLRTDTSSNIVIDTDLPSVVDNVTIPPMILIPFVENAFKHGISFLEPSYIKIALGLKNNILYFDVINSVHKKLDFDPEKSSGGIGLNNVKQRLALSYPKHELVVRGTNKDFFIHLTLELSEVSK